MFVLKGSKDCAAGNALWRARGVGDWQLSVEGRNETRRRDSYDIFICTLCEQWNFSARRGNPCWRVTPSRRCGKTEKSFSAGCKRKEWGRVVRRRSAGFGLEWQNARAACWGFFRFETKHQLQRKVFLLLLPVTLRSAGLLLRELIMRDKAAMNSRLFSRNSVRTCSVGLRELFA